jgi:predicted MPP superfamily phosphohydrolase
MEERLEQHGIVVLRNEVHHVKPKKTRTPLAIVGLDDEWSGHIDPDAAFDSVDPSLPIVCLNHNPANVLELMRFPWQWMLAGHTHGRQLAVTRMGKALNRKRFRHWTRGYYHLNGRHLYVNRGLSYGQRVHHWCRPEVTVFELESEVHSE